MHPELFAMLSPAIDRRNASRANAPAGFTFVELTIVVLILGILAAAAAPKYRRAMGRAQVESAARVLAADLNRARGDAQAKSTTRTVQFTEGGSVYSISGLTGLDHRGQTHTVDLAAAGYDCTITSAAFGAGHDVTFDLYGRADVAGSIGLRSGGQTRTVAVDKSGEISITP